MCGIVGMVRPGPGTPMAEAELVAMRDSLRHRGPDDAGTYRADGVALGSRRLAILDTSHAGHMPMATSDGRYWMVYNGEVYNFRALRSIAQARGQVFRSKTDTEVLLHLYASEGPACLERLNGMFALAIWDSVERTLFLARDRVGIKPLYYHLGSNGRLAFASEAKALFAAGIPSTFDQACWEELLCFRHVAGERTPFVNVKRLLPGHYLTWKNGAVDHHCWWDLSERTVAARSQRIENPRQWFARTFDDASDMRTISDVPVGVLLSGGLDSSSIVASLGARGHQGLSTFCVRFDDPSYDEGSLAREVAGRWKLDHHELTISRDQILPWLQKACRLHDEPPAHANDLHLLAISEYAKPRVSVLLSGEGADETLGGYVRYQPLRWAGALEVARHWVPKLAGIEAAPARVRKLARVWQEGGLDALLTFNQCDVLPSDLRKLGMPTASEYAYREGVLTKARRLYPGDLIRQAMFADQHTFLSSLLDRNDRMTMGASIECRAPFLDYRLVEGLAGMPSSDLLPGLRGKPLLRNAIGKRLPPRVRRHRKWGFGVPWTQYFRDEPQLREIVMSLPSLSPIAEGPLVRAALRRAITQFFQGDDRHGALILALATIAVWYQACDVGASTRDVRVVPYIAARA
jgi:asparagine synthase (glutamine-hydrolysing)